MGLEELDPGLIDYNVEMGSAKEDGRKKELSPSWAVENFTNNSETLGRILVFQKK